MKMNIIFYQTKTKFSNTGDALINKTLMQVLREYGKIKANCNGVPEEFIKELGIEDSEKIYCANEITYTIKIIKTAIINKQDKIYVFSGLGDVHGGSAKRVIKGFMAALICFVYKVWRIQSVRIGRSVGDITKGMELCEVLRSKSIDYNYVRDMQSLQRCKSFGVKNIDYCPDLSWLFLESENREMNNGTNVIISMRGSTLGKYEDEYVKKALKMCEVILQQIQMCLNKNIEVCFIYQVKEDENTCRVLYDYFKKSYNCIMIDKQLKLIDMEGVYGKSIFHISNRMHSLLLGYKYGSVPIALIDKEKHLKITSTLEDCKLDELIVDINDVKQCRGIIENIIKRKTDIYETIIFTEKRMQEKVRVVLDSIML